MNSLSSNEINENRRLRNTRKIKSNRLMGKKKMRKVRKKKITRTRKIYRLGRKKKNGKPTSLTIGLLLPSIDVRKKIEEDISSLNNHGIDKIKNELKSQNLISTGTLAPESILKNTYINSVLCGKLENKNPERLLENFMAVGRVNEEENSF